MFQVTHRYFLLRNTDENDGGLRLKLNFSNAFICFESGAVYSLANLLLFESVGLYSVPFDTNGDG